MTERDKVLPRIPLPKNTVTVHGNEIEFRSLSRAEALKVTTQFKDDPDAAEIFILACGVGVTEAEAEAWRAEVDPISAGKVIDGIILLTGLNDPEGKA